MVSPHPNDHNNEKIEIGQISQFSAIMIFMLKILLILAFFPNAPFSEIKQR